MSEAATMGAMDRAKTTGLLKAAESLLKIKSLPRETHERIKAMNADLQGHWDAIPEAEREAAVPVETTAENWLQEADRILGQSDSADQQEGDQQATEADAAAAIEADTELVEAADLVGEIVPLAEAVVGEDGTIPVKVIQPGWGSSGYYSPEVLRRDGPTAFASGLHMYWDHPSHSQESDRPERSLRDLAGVLVEDAKWADAGASGPGLYAKAKVFSPYAGNLEELAPHIGLSIRGRGKCSEGKVAGKKGKIVEELTSGHSVDFVTVAGAGGQVVDLFESAGSGEQKQEVVKMGEPELKELKEIGDRLQVVEAENKRLREGALLREAREIVHAGLASTTLPDVTKERLLESLSANPPIKDDAIDEAEYDTRIKDAVKAEALYLAKITGPTVRGLGVSETEPTGTLKESFTEMYRRQGKTTEEAEKLAELAAA